MCRLMGRGWLQLLEVSPFFLSAGGGVEASGRQEAAVEKLGIETLAFAATDLFGFVQMDTFESGPPRPSTTPRIRNSPTNRSNWLR